ncbi:MAG: DNA-binding response regulator [Chloroflexi bacterium]|nr:MAG: DNA-binding response regulator [Chloroflexota bacterium]
MIRVLIADDQTVLRHGLRLILNESEHITVVGEAANGEEAVKQAIELKPDVVLMDVNMPLLDGIEATRQIRAVQPETRVLMLTISKKDVDLLGAIRAGARGYLLKSAEAQEVISAICRVAAGEAILPPNLASFVFDELASTRPPTDELTGREIEILGLIAEGQGNKEIAAALHISENTVKTHVRHILEKLQLSNRAEAAAYAVRAGLVRRE